MSRPKLAVVVPAYNEESRILPTLERINEYFQSVDYSVAVIVVSDGSRDRTNEIVEIFSSTNEATSLLAYSPNRGKGYAVRRGILSADADYVLFSDADLAAPIEEIEKLWLAISDDVPVAIGSRPLKESNLEIRQPWYREMLGRLFNKAVQTLAIRGIEDTQCGFKIFRQDVAQDVFSRCKLDGFGFDFESLMIARDLGYQIAEVPIRWSHQEGSKVVLMRDGPRMIRDLIKLRLWGKRKRLEANPER
ncbi:glycosyltransferase family 2 protein [Geitlerinema splendidum]|nr:glycosyltransferase family 2 protein [Geitlerinema splendidum]